MSYSISDEMKRTLVEAAKSASQSAYCPYSNYSVGSAVLTFDDRLYKGCNVENSAYSQTIHAEENAVSSAIADGLLIRAEEAGLLQTQAIKAMSVFAPKGTQPWPCLNCRQFLCEFGLEFSVYGYDRDKNIIHKQLKELVPFMFPIENVLASIKDGKGFQKKEL